MNAFIFYTFLYKIFLKFIHYLTQLMNFTPYSIYLTAFVFILIKLTRLLNKVMAKIDKKQRVNANNNNNNSENLVNNIGQYVTQFS